MISGLTSYEMRLFCPFLRKRAMVASTSFFMGAAKALAVETVQITSPLEPKKLKFCTWIVESRKPRLTRNLHALWNIRVWKIRVSTQKEEKSKGHECLILKNLRVLPVLIWKNEGSKAFKIAKFTPIWSKLPNLAHKCEKKWQLTKILRVSSIQIQLEPRVS